MKIMSRKLVFLAIDIVLVNIAVYIALILKFEGNIPFEYISVFIKTAFFITILKIIIYNFFNLYKSLWKYASIEELLQVLFATMTGSVIVLIFHELINQRFPISVYPITWMLTFIFIGGSRMAYRITRRFKSINFLNGNNVKRIMIIGAGDIGSTIIKELKKNIYAYGKPVVIIDDDKAKINSNIHGIPVRGDRTQIPDIAVKYAIDEIIIAIPFINKDDIKEIISICTKTKCTLRTLPAIKELINGEIDIKKIRDVNIEDLLGRDPVQLNNEEISEYLKDEVVMVTGGGGSIGSELCRQIATYNPGKLIIFDIYENNAYDIQNELNHLYGDSLDVEILIGSVQDNDRLEYIFSKYKPSVVFHAAAHKHVPLMELNPTEAIKNNIFGTLNTAQCADKYGAKKFVLISTDKAVNPTNIMGATKRVAEMIIQHMSRYSLTEFTAVRFGNVLGSNGSVIPLFKKQIAHGGPVTVTHPEITRYFMLIPEAAQLVIEAGAMAKGGEIFILDMGEPVKIVDLAHDLIRLSGMEPGVDIEIKYTGLRPGEKLYEELLLAEEGVQDTKHEKIFVGKPMDIDYKTLMKEINSLKAILMDPDRVGSDVSKDLIFEFIQRMVPTYTKIS